MTKMRMSRLALLLMLPGLLVAGAAEAQGLATRPGLLVSVNQPSFAVGDTLTTTVGITNSGWPELADLFVGLALPNGTIVFFTSTGFAFGNAADPASFQPIATGVNLSSPFSVTIPNFFSYPWTGTEPRGTYVFFFLVLQNNALANGSVAQSEMIASAATSFIFP